MIPIDRVRVILLTAVKRSAMALFLRGWLPARAVRWLFAALPLRGL